jgi:hypothetical protein
VPLDNLPADGETHPGPFILTFHVQALEDGEDAVEILLVETDAVILYGDLTEL